MKNLRIWNKDITLKQILGATGGNKAAVVPAVKCGMVAPKRVCVGKYADKASACTTQCGTWELMNIMLALDCLR